MNKLTLKPISLLLAGAALFGATAAQATVIDEYLKLDGVQGLSTDRAHKGWSDVSNISWSIEAETSFLKGSGAAVGKPTPSAVSWTQNLDSTAASLYQKIYTGTPYKTATFDYVPLTERQTSAPYMSLGLKDAFVTHVGFNNNVLDAAVVSKAMSWTYTPSALGGKAASSTLTWDIAKNTVSGPTGRVPDTSFQGITSAADAGEVRAYLRLDGIAGDSRVRGYENWIDVGNVSWNVDAEHNILQGSGAAVGKPVPGSLSWMQALDGSVLPELTHILMGTQISTATLEFVTNFGNGPTTIMQMAMENVFFSKVSANDTNVTDEVVFKKYTQTFWDIDPKGNRGQGVSVGFDFSAYKPYIGQATTPPSGFGTGNLAPMARMEAPLPPAAPAPVPEPETYGMLLAGLGLLGFIARRRNSAAA